MIYYICYYILPIILFTVMGVLFSLLSPDKRSQKRLGQKGQGQKRQNGLKKILSQLASLFITNESWQLISFFTLQYANMLLGKEKFQAFIKIMYRSNCSGSQGNFVPLQSFKMLKNLL